ncbi:Na/Pi cotransporter family protein [bacterium]|nr:Na/Pi cotransporter family protein [bacterium]
MSFSMIIEIIVSVIGGLGIFLLGMHNLSNGLQNAAGERLRWMIGKVTHNRISGALIGTGVTTLIQSSSITTVMVVGFVNAGIMTLSQSIGVIMGANIGTTITGWILVINIGKYGLPILGFFAIINVFSRKERVKFISAALMGLGMIFFGLEAMKNGFKPMTKVPEFVEMFHAFSADTYFGVLKCILTGAILTMIVQSSSATLGITISLATTGMIPFETAAALVLGENIGTTITAYLASLGTQTNAKRVAFAHILFNILGVTWVFILFFPYMAIITKIIGANPNSFELIDGVKSFPYIAAAIASVHTIFNITNTLLFLPFTKQLEKLLIKLIKDKPQKEETHLTQLDKRMFESPILIIEQSHLEISKMGHIIDDMFDNLDEFLQKDSDSKTIFEKEDEIDIRQKEVSIFLMELLSKQITTKIAFEANMQLGIADEYESVSDYLRDIAKLKLKLKDNSLSLTEEKLADLSLLHKKIKEYFIFMRKAVDSNDKAVIKQAFDISAEITKCFKELRKKHLDRIAQTPINPLLSTVYTDMLNAYRRVKYHIFHISENL